MRLLYIEDNAVIRQRVAETLRENGFDVEEIATAREARRAFAETVFDLVLLDILLPDGNGIELLRELRSGKNARIPVILLSALGEMLDERVSGLEAGANDYLAKPFDTRELIARIHAVMRSVSPNAETPPEFIRLRGGRLNLRQFCAERDDGSRIPLSMKEFYLLRYFTENEGREISVEEILSQVWKIDSTKTSTASPVVFVSRLRRKLGNLCEIETLRNSGYRFRLR